MLEKVVIVGGGVAGLRLAKLLLDNYDGKNFEVVLIEAGEALGGRLLSIDVEGVPIDIGAAWIHGDSTENVIMQYLPNHLKKNMLCSTCPGNLWVGDFGPCCENLVANSCSNLPNVPSGGITPLLERLNKYIYALEGKEDLYLQNAFEKFFDDVHDKISGVEIRLLRYYINLIPRKYKILFLFLLKFTSVFIFISHHHQFGLVSILTAYLLPIGSK